MTTYKRLRVGKWGIPTGLMDDYIRFSIMADGYLSGTLATPSGLSGNIDAGGYERRLRYVMCVEQLMKIHREICAVLGIGYSENINDEFYSAFHEYVEKKKRLKG